MTHEYTILHGGTILSGAASMRPATAIAYAHGIVIAVGDDEEAIKVAPGDLVLFARYAGTELRLDGTDYLILDASDLLAVIGKDTVQARSAA